MTARETLTRLAEELEREADYLSSQHDPVGANAYDRCAAAMRAALGDGAGLTEGEKPQTSEVPDRGGADATGGVARELTGSPTRCGCGADTTECDGVYYCNATDFWVGACPNEPEPLGEKPRRKR